MSDDNKDLGNFINDAIEGVDRWLGSDAAKTIEAAVSDVVENVGNAMKQASKEATDDIRKNLGRYTYQNYSGQMGKKTYTRQPNAYYSQEAGGYVYPEHQGYNKTNSYMANKRRQQPSQDFWTGNQQLVRRSKPSLPMVKGAPGMVPGVMLGIAGGLMFAGAVGVFFVSDVLFLVTHGFMSLAAGPIAGVAALLGGSAVAGGIGTKMRRTASRFRDYARLIGTRTRYDIEEFAKAIGKKDKFVRKDLKKMIDKGWFPQGHVDDKNNCFLLTDAAYDEFKTSEQAYEERLREEKLAEEELEKDPVKRQLKETVDEGRDGIRRIKEVNARIPDEGITEKLNRLETVCTNIFDRIEEKPEKLPELRRFMNYFLPTTLKLVEKYEVLYNQPVEGENITKAKAEIEEMLDNINVAFEKMFDRMFKEEAIDISTDISTMKVMMSQEGLMDEDFFTGE